MIDVFNEVDGPVLAIERVPKSDVSAYGIIDAEEIKPGVFRIRDLVEKPPPTEAPSDLAIIGRYILTPDIFPALEETARDRTGEIQLTNGLRRLLKSRPIYGCRIDGVRHDTGNKLGFLKAVVYFALRRPDLAGKFTDYLRGIDLGGAGVGALTRFGRYVLDSAFESDFGLRLGGADWLDCPMTTSRTTCCRSTCPASPISSDLLDRCAPARRPIRTSDSR